MSKEGEAWVCVWWIYFKMVGALQPKKNGSN